MRRSLGVGLAEPPRRLRQSAEFQQGSASRPSRPRPSIKGPEASGGGRRQSSSQSRLPVAAKATKARSTSTGPGPMQERSRNTLATPLAGGKRAGSSARSSERAASKPRTDYQTPQRVAQSGRKSLMTGSAAGKRLSGRGSQVGAKTVKDTRPLQDKEFQQQQTRRILDFLRREGYPNNTLTSKNFPLASREFVNIFNFIYQFIEPRNTEVLTYPSFHEPVLELLKVLNYPGNIPRSHFVTLGSQHSWPAVLGCLSFLVELASAYTYILQPDNIRAIAFPSDFDNENGVKEKLKFEHYINCFEQFNAGQDEFSEELDNLKNGLMDNLGVDLEHLHSLDTNAQSLQAELDNLKSKGNSKEDLEEQKAATEADIAKITEYLTKKEERHAEKREEVGRMQQQVEEAAAMAEGLELQAHQLRTDRVQAKVSSYEADRIAALVKEKRNHLDTAQKDIDEVEKENYLREVQTSKLVAAVDDLAKQTNSLALEEDIKDKDGVMIELPKVRFSQDKEAVAVSPALKPMLAELVRGSKAEWKNREKELQSCMEQEEQGREATQARRREVEVTKAEVARLVAEAVEVKEAGRAAEKVFDKQLAEVGSSLEQLRGRSHGDLQEQQAELQAAEERLAGVAAERKEKLAEGRQFLKDVIEMMVTYMEETTGHKDRAHRAVLEQAKRRIAEVRATVLEVEDRASAALAAARTRNGS